MLKGNTINSMSHKWWKYITKEMKHNLIELQNLLFLRTEKAKLLAFRVNVEV